MQMRDHVRQQAMQRARAQVVPALGPDIHRVSDQDCATRNDFFKLWNDTTSAYGVCFAGDGPIDINVYNVYEIDSGNNSGNFVAAVNSHFPGNGLQMCAWSSALFDSGIYHANLYDVTQVTITGRSSSPCQPSTVYQV